MQPPTEPGEGERALVDLSLLDTRTMPLAYGTERCQLVLNDSRYTEELVTLRNDEGLNRYIHHEPLTAAGHDRWLRQQLERRDALNFAVLVEGKFAGAASLYDITRDSAEYGRLIMNRGSVREYSTAVSLLAHSFGFEIIALKSIYCRILEGNERTHRHALKVGYRRDSTYDQEVTFDGEETRLLGFSQSSEDWLGVFEANLDLLRRLHLRREAE
jgi:RimJ/RimL family protein N-acetyltransferase